MKNFKRLADMINVKMGEKWLANNGYWYRINNDRIEYYNEFINSWREHLNDYKDIILGKIYPIKPTEKGDVYYYIDFTSITGINIKEYQEDETDRIIAKRKMGFPTLELAEKKLIEMLSK